MVPKFSKKDIVNFNEETLYKEYKEAETNLNILILKINKELKKINSKGKCGL